MKRKYYWLWTILLPMLAVCPHASAQAKYYDTVQQRMYSYYLGINSHIDKESTRGYNRDEIATLFIDPEKNIVYNDLNLLEGKKISRQTNVAEYLRQVQRLANARGNNVFRVEHEEVKGSYVEAATAQYVDWLGKRVVVSSIDIDKVVIYGNTQLYIRDHVVFYDGLIGRIESSSRKPNKSDAKRVPTSRRVELFATWQGRRTQANVYISPAPPNASEASGYQSSFSVELPYGRYEVQMTGGGRTASRTITVTERGEVSFEFKLKEHHKFVWPWEKDYEHRVVGLTIGYSQGHIAAELEGGAQAYFDDAWGHDNEYFRGGQVGVCFQPCTQWGGGLYTGLFYQYSYSSNTPTRDDEGLYDEVFTSCSEQMVMLPAHLLYRLVLAKWLSVNVHGGFNVAYYFGKRYDDSRGNFLTTKPEYGTADMCNHLDFSYSLAAGVQLGRFQLEAVWTNGLTNHDSRVSDADGNSLKAKRENLSFRISLML